MISCTAICSFFFQDSKRLRCHRFRWVACQLDALKDCFDYELLTNALASLPKTLDETYTRILDSIPESHRRKAVRILQLLAFAVRPLRVKEIVDAVAVNLDGEPHFDLRNRMPDPAEILRYCSSLVVVVPGQPDFYDDDIDGLVDLQLAHFSVKEYLISSRVHEGFSHAFQEYKAKLQISIVCVRYMMHVDWDLQQQELRRVFPFAQYCTLYWVWVAGKQLHTEDFMELRRIMAPFLVRTRAFMTALISQELDKIGFVAVKSTEQTQP